MAKIPLFSKIFIQISNISKILSIFVKKYYDRERVNKTVRMDRRVTAIESFGSKFDGFLLSIEEGKALGGLRNVEATEILRRSQETGFGASERRLTAYAKENDCWFDLKEIKTDFQYLGSGA